LPVDPRFVGSNPAEDDGFLRAIKVRSTSFGGEVKPSVTCKILWYVKRPLQYEGDIFRKNSRAFTKFLLISY
jgi:hypothetical protein